MHHRFINTSARRTVFRRERELIREEQRRAEIERDMAGALVERKRLDETQARLAHPGDVTVM